MTQEITIEASTRQAITLDGIHGVFRIQNCDFDIHYFSTYATPSKDAAEEPYSALLGELKPMRERVKAKDLKDLNTLLQRDLSDQRIAQELVPYLCGATSKVGFFPPVLAVLVPTGFIESAEGSAARYPVPTVSGSVTDYDGLWQLKFHGGTQRLARLSIYAGTEIIVLDGQHRANAFRYVSGVLKPTDLYGIFYDGSPKPSAFTSDLPVVIVWFKSVGKKLVQPNDISRELFVAVNNNAKTVSQSRTILLDEANPVCLAVNAYYSTLAKKRGFKPGGMNLLCGCFDVDVDDNMTAYRPVFALTDPVALKIAITYAFFGLEKYDSLKVSKANRKAQTNKSRCDRLFGPLPYIDSGGGKRIKPITDVSSRQDFRGRVEKRFAPILDALLEESQLAACHHEAVVQLEDWVRGGSGVSSIVVDAWDKVFCGGEGLFAQVQQAESSTAKTYRKAIKEIQEKFREIRRGVVRKACGKGSKFTDEWIDAAFELYDTIACQTGILMAASVYMKILHKRRAKPDTAIKKACDLINKPTVAEWLHFFNVFRELYFSKLETNSWPRFQKLFLRLYCLDCDEFVKAPGIAPEVEMASERAVRQLQALHDSGESVGPAEKKRVVDDAIAEVQDAFKRVNQKCVKRKAIADATKAAVETYFKKRAQRSALGSLVEEPDDSTDSEESADYEQV